MTSEKKNVSRIEKWCLTQVITLCYMLKSHLQILIFFRPRVMPDPRRLDSTTPHIWGVIVCKAINDK
jgi:hypothetical protein